MKLIIPGIPIAKARPRFRRTGKHLQAYDPQQKEKEHLKVLISSMINSRINENDKEFICELSQFSKTSAFIVHLVFYFPVLSTKNLSPWLVDEHIFKPDIDNTCKYILDILTKHLIPDDRQIVEMHCQKRFSKTPRTEITIMPKKKITLHDKVKSIMKIFDPPCIQEFYEDVETLEMLCKGINFQNLDMVNSEWLSAAACFLSAFSYRYCDKLNKVKKFGNIIQEIDEHEKLSKT